MSDVVARTENLEEIQTAGTAIKLSRAITWEDTEYKELTLDFDGLSGDDIMAIESDFMDFIAGQKNVFVKYKTEHPGYHAVVAAKASGVNPLMLKKLTARDFLKVTGAAKDFLNGLV
ncbi:hypothetical protein E6C60_3103 [Paenibacillus algicola]|uniref:Phage tail assembly chaperone protein, E, or 41 or 14 n=1 Tax=Paenibacillus algicola TaxID=2565926 RepID=A0A4V1G485_9BACL|nr:phage tail assembly protein [Paenibacillus algicola]QCT03814.1 hypothetical protein E6C60_3103 [Paenibacillus algicola]